MPIAFVQLIQQELGEVQEVGFLGVDKRCVRHPKMNVKGLKFLRLWPRLPILDAVQSSSLYPCHFG
ncbi:MAG: hypothetical protein M5U09_13660 [Gammaproteobacteria bacterium]|nr:hypothetical protein [Gammaproteobacteria bacterium]